MKDGQVAVIRQWTIVSYVGRVVQRYGQSLVTLGARAGNSFPSLFDSEAKHFQDCRVEVLNPGAELVLEEK